jgi:hypothetical protein
MSVNPVNKKIELDIRDILDYHYRTKEVVNMTVHDDALLIDSLGELGVEGGSLTITIKIIDVKYTYGIRRFKVTPVEGKGEKWVDAARVYSPHLDSNR